MIKKIIGWVDWQMFLFFMDFTEDELNNMPARLVILYKKVHDVLTYTMLAWAFTYAAARVYEVMMIANYGVVTPNMIQFMPLLVWLIQIIIIFGIHPWFERQEMLIHGYGHNA